MLSPSQLRLDIRELGFGILPHSMQPDHFSLVAGLELGPIRRPTSRHGCAQCCSMGRLTTRGLVPGDVALLFACSEPSLPRVPRENSWASSPRGTSTLSTEVSLAPLDSDGSGGLGADITEQELFGRVNTLESQPRASSARLSTSLFTLHTSTHAPYQLRMHSLLPEIRNFLLDIATGDYVARPRLRR